jgi:hypothetical protein
MATLLVRLIAPSGVVPDYVAASVGGDAFANDGMTVLHVKNGGVADVTVTVNSITPCNQGFDHDSAAVVPSGEERMIGPFPPARFGMIAAVGYSSVAGLTVAAVAVPGR